jgi:hypothetical protein
MIGVDQASAITGTPKIVPPCALARSQTASGVNAAHCHAINFNVVAMPIKVLVYS